MTTPTLASRPDPPSIARELGLLRRMAGAYSGGQRALAERLRIRWSRTHSHPARRAIHDITNEDPRRDPQHHAVNHAPDCQECHEPEGDHRLTTHTLALTNLFSGTDRLHVERFDDDTYHARDPHGRIRLTAHRARFTIPPDAAPVWIVVRTPALQRLRLWWNLARTPVRDVCHPRDKSPCRHRLWAWRLCPDCRRHLPRRRGAQGE